MVILLVTTQSSIIMGKSTHFSGQPLYCQVIKLLNKSKVLQHSRVKGGEWYVKRFDG